MQWKIGYKLCAFSSILIGKAKTLKFLLILNRIIARFAHELAGEFFGAKYHNSAFALSQETLFAAIASGDRILDVGCGSGRFSRLASQKALKVIAVDHNPLHFQDPNFQASNIETVILNIDTDLSYLGSFDVALCIHILEHIEDPKDLLTKLSKIAKKLIIEVPDLYSDPLNWARIKLHLDYSSDHDHVREYTLELISEQCLTTGWIIDEVHKQGGAILIQATSKNFVVAT